ncbi:hypothetical protein XELAEV_18029395mg [Xenopus laevis]|uniref:Uncharacterized protein n=1 Tax=Xenopus laevis TaxID=8355 RepID=A0A974HHI4_XENLA|nr:hypothetical protein XELAEV_18029395mg [Xenopus laevis]
MVLGITHKRHMIPAPPAVSSVPNTDAPQSRHHILRKQNFFKPFGKLCIPFHSIPQTANARVCSLPGSNGMERNAAFSVRLKCAHVYAAIFSFTAVPYFTIFPLPPLPLIQCGALIVGANLIAFKGSGRNFCL